MTLEARLDKGYLALYVLITIIILVAAHSIPEGGSCVDNGAGPVPSLLDSGSGQETQSALPQDSFQRCATKALRGDFGKLQPWQHDAYRKAVDRGATVCGKAWVTNYGPNEGRQGQIDSKGSPCTTRTAAANRIKRGSYVWVARTKGGGATIRQVLDCGAKYNDNIARRKGARLWIDLWVPWADNWSTICDYAVIGGE